MYIEMKGRLGNQFFIYAFSRYISTITGDNELNFDFSFIEKKRKQLKEGNWEDNLKYFHVKPYNIIHCNRRAALDCSTFTQKIVLYSFWLKKHLACRDNDKRYEMEKRWQRKLNKHGIYLAQDRFVRVNKSDRKNLIIVGHFESSLFFESIKSQLQKEFVPIYDPLPQNFKIYNEILNSQSVCVTIRRGDYVNIADYKKEFFLCDFDYFKKGMDYIYSVYHECKFFIFSDDINWVKENYEFEYPVVYESGTDPIWEKLRLMYSCKHFVISNSTFSWWAQYLSKNEEKIVVAPEKWNNYGKKSDLLEKQFIKIGV